MEYFPLGHLGTQLDTPLSAGRSAALRARDRARRSRSSIRPASIHRDLKPGNIMLRDDDSVALIDFGISHSAHVVEKRRRRAARKIAGTPYYMSPEQAAAQPTDERTDLYALGVILYQMLTGEKPYVGRHHSGDPRPAPQRRRCRGSRAGLGAYQPLLNKLLAKDPRQRFGERARGSRSHWSRFRHRRTGAPHALAG